MYRGGMAKPASDFAVVPEALFGTPRPDGAEPSKRKVASPKTLTPTGRWRAVEPIEVWSQERRLRLEPGQIVPADVPEEQLAQAQAGKLVEAELS